MKLLELEIYNTRGIRHMALKPNGKNFVVWGPNGSGKSAVVDAIDFLLTGRITRLTGKGTGNITLSKHGPHIDCKPEDATVRAIVQLRGVKDPIEIRRCIAQPNALECNEAAKPNLESIMTLARRGQHVLTRREVLRYITAEGSTRAEEIQELLNITEIEEARKALVKAQNEISKDFQATQRSLEMAKGAVSATLQRATFQPETALEIVNQNRAVLGAPPIATIHSAQLKANIKLPTAASNDRPVNVTLLEADIENLQKVLPKSSQAEISAYDEQLHSTIGLIHSDPSLLKAYSQQQLVLLGVRLIDETGKCPLCDTLWEQGKLREHLEHKLSLAQVAGQYQKRITDASTAISNRVNATLASLQKVIAVVQLIGLNNELDPLKQWQDKLQGISNALSYPVERYLASGFESSSIKQLLAPDNLVEVAVRILSAVKTKFPEATPEQTAWDTLTRLEENIKALEKAEAEHQATKVSLQRASVLVNAFQHARDSVLKKIYDSIKDRFVSLYKELHGPDEGNFDARLEPEGAALNLEVGFYGRGTHPPHALHSEGHQDSMGLCLYLALAERLTEGLIDLIILDDVVMSVDADHRRELCRLFAKEFPDRQFIITTHDKTWATQLKTEGVVTSRSSVEFYNWNVETGPQVNNEENSWERIEQYLQNGDVSSAAARLRRWSEQFFSMTCDSLQAFVKYKLNSRWELGDFLPASIGQYHEFLKQAKRAAQSWNDKETVRMLSELDSTAGQIYSRTNVEQWAINASVHYNNWANLSPQDFRPVVESFQDLYGLFICSTCGGMLYVASAGLTPVNVRCNCGKVNWNLKENPAAPKP